MSEIQLRAFQPGDANQAPGLLAEAFREDPLFYYWCRRGSSRYEKRLHAFAGILNDLQRASKGYSLGVFAGERLLGLAYVKSSAAMSQTSGLAKIVLTVLLRCGLGSLLRFIKVGSALPKNWPEAEHLYLSLLAVDPAYQGQGFGRRLLAAVQQYAQDAGFSDVCLDTQNPDNVGYYQASGYRVIGDLQVDELRSWCLLKN